MRHPLYSWYHQTYPSHNRVVLITSCTRYPSANPYIASAAISKLIMDYPPDTTPMLRTHAHP